MRRRLIIAGLIVLCSFAPAGRAADGGLSGSSGVVVYYFHRAVRCSSCIRMESYVREIIEKYYGAELDSGKLEFRAVNLEEPGMEHFKADYLVSSSSLVLSLVKNGVEKEKRNLARIHEYLPDKERFYRYIWEELDAFILKL